MASGADERFRSHVPALLAMAAASVGVSIGLSYFGVAGTLTGMMLGSLATGGLAWWMERLLRRGAARAQALTDARKRKGGPLTIEETQIIRAVTDAKHRHRYRGVPWKLAALGAAAVFVVTGGTVTVVALAAGRPVGGIAHPAVHQPRPRVPVVATPPASRPATVPVATSSPPPTAAPSPTPTPTPSPSPDVTPVATSTASPSAAASGTPTL